MSYIAMPDFTAAKIIIEKRIEFILFRIGVEVFIIFFHSFHKNYSLVWIGKEINQVFLRDAVDVQIIAYIIISFPGKWQDLIGHPDRDHSSSCYRIDNTG